MITTVIIVLLIFGFIYGFMDAEMDTLRFRPKKAWSKNPLWIRSNWNPPLFIEAWSITNATVLWYVNSRWGWYSIKTIFSFLLDEWHLVKFIKETSLAITIILLSVLAVQASYYWLFASIAWSVYRGGIWELTYS